MRGLLFAIAGISVALAFPAAGQQLTLGTTANPAPAAVFLADQNGIFKKNGVDLKVLIVTTDATVPAALVSNSVQLAAVTPTTLLTAVASGIDIVALTGTAVTTRESKDVAIIASKKSGITDAKGFAGKTLGVASIGAVLDVMLRTWLDQNGVDVTKVKFIELPFPTQADQLKAGRVDGVITVDQFAQRMLGEGIGVLVAHPLSDLPGGQTAQEVVAMRSWAEANRPTVAAIRAALAEAEAMGKADPGKVRAALGNAMKLPPPITEKIALPTIDVSLKAEQLSWWLQVMKKQRLIKADVDTAKLIFK